jgi:hypothetical protein
VVEWEEIFFSEGLSSFFVCLVETTRRKHSTQKCKERRTLNGYTFHLNFGSVLMVKPQEMLFLYFAFVITVFTRRFARACADMVAQRRMTGCISIFAHTFLPGIFDIKENEKRCYFFSYFFFNLASYCHQQQQQQHEKWKQLTNGIESKILRNTTYRVSNTHQHYLFARLCRKSKAKPKMLTVWSFGCKEVQWIKFSYPYLSGRLTTETMVINYSKS